MSYLIRKASNRAATGYVQNPGSKRSYGGIANARHYSTYSAAMADKCDNETVVARYATD